MEGQKDPDSRESRGRGLQQGGWHSEAQPTLPFLGNRCGDNSTHLKITWNFQRSFKSTFPKPQCVCVGGVGVGREAEQACCIHPLCLIRSNLPKGGAKTLPGSIQVAGAWARAGLQGSSDS
jgi:hypothetical protein